MATQLVRKANNSKKIMDKSAKIYIAGHRGMVGSAIERKLSLIHI
jgi:hypothetical protein